jgi:hypothetical protein
VRPFDFFFTAIAAAALAVSAFFVYAVPQGGALVTITGGKRLWQFPLDALERVEVEGPLGNTVIEIKGGGARIVSSPCLNKTCINTGSINRAGRFAACLPNQVILSVEGGGAEADAGVW